MLELFTAVGHVTASLLAAAMIIVTAFGVGIAILRALKLETSGQIELATWSITLGLVACGSLLALVGLLGFLYVPLLGALSVVGAAWGLGNLYRSWLETALATSGGVTNVDNPDETNLGPPRWLQMVLTVLALIVVITSLVSALAPPTAGDALCYHLELPKAFLAEHRLSYFPYQDNSTFPLLSEMWFLWALALEGPVAAQLLAWCGGLLLAGATCVLATPILGRGWGQVAGLANLLVPGINNHMAAPLVDAPTALLTTLMLAAWLRAARAEENRSWLIVAGCLLGAACGVKYTGLVWIAAWAVVVGIECWRRSAERRELLRRAGVVLVIAVSVGGPWYLRAAYYRGDPVWPFLSAWLPVSSPPPETVDKTRLGLAPLEIVTAPWELTIHPEQFGGRGHRLGALFLMLLPGLLIARRLRGLTTLCAIAATYAGGWYLLRQNVRFLYPIVPLLIVAASWSFVEVARWPVLPRRLAIALLAAIVALDSAGPLLRARNNVAVALGWESRDDYLLRNEPTYRAACVANAIARPKSRILSQDYRAFYFNAAVTRENVYRRVTNYDRTLNSRPLAKQLKARGFTHLLLVSTVGDSGAHIDSTLSQLVDAQRKREKWSNRQLVCLDDYDFVDADGVTRNYRLIELR